jgi:cbb3-type cytochrome oxidase maturation protein
VQILLLLIPLGLALVALALWAFFWAVGDGQFDDLDSPGWSVVDDEDELSRERPAAPDGRSG